MKKCTKRRFGTTASGAEVFEYTIENGQGMSFSVINYGGRITRLLVPDRDGEAEDITPGYDTLQAYEWDPVYFGAILGRYANRIAKGRFTLDGVDHTLAQNNPPNCSHGGVRGFNTKVWQVTVVETEDSTGVQLSYTSPDREENFPGNLDVEVIFSLNAANELSFEYRAVTDKSTVCNLSNHIYFNLAGHDKGTIDKHLLRVCADRYTPLNRDQIPTGEITAVAGTALDFRQRREIGLHIDAADEQLRLARGYDHNWILDKPEGSFGFAAELIDPASGRRMEVWTTEPGLQVYTGNYLKEALPGKAACVYRNRSAVALESQHFPDSPNQPNFPSTRLDPGRVYRSKTIYRFKMS